LLRRDREVDEVGSLIPSSGIRILTEEALMCDVKALVRALRERVGGSTGQHTNGEQRGKQCVRLPHLCRWWELARRHVILSQQGWARLAQQQVIAPQRRSTRQQVKRVATESGTGFPARQERQTGG